MSCSSAPPAWYSSTARSKYRSHTPRESGAERGCIVGGGGGVGAAAGSGAWRRACSSQEQTRVRIAAALTRGLGARRASDGSGGHRDARGLGWGAWGFTS